MLLPFREHLDFGPTPYDRLQGTGRYTGDQRKCREERCPYGLAEALWQPIGHLKMFSESFQPQQPWSTCAK